MSENFLAFLFIFAGIFLILSVLTESAGLVGRGVKFIFLGIFGELSVLIALLMIFGGSAKLIYPQLSYRKLKKPTLLLAGLALFLLYGLWNKRWIPLFSPFSFTGAADVFVSSVAGEGMGLIPALFIYLMQTLIGFYGCLVLVAALLILLGKLFFLKDEESKKALREGVFSFRERISALLLRLKERFGEEKGEKARDDLLSPVTKEEPPLEREAEAEEQSVLTETRSPEEETAGGGEAPYTLPEVSLLKSYPKSTKEEISPKSRSARLLESTLLNFGVDAKVRQVSQGPTITRYELEPKAGTKVSKITNLTEDLALALAAKTIRIEAPIPGKSLIGIEVPNEAPETVPFREIVESSEFSRSAARIVFGLGKDIAGRTMIADIAKMPHLLVAGATGSGKSVCINTLICSILYKYSPEQLRMIMIDPKMVELSVYNGIPHLLVPVVTDMKKAPSALNWAVAEMNRRYKLFAENRVKDIDGYNEKAQEKLPRILIIVDELADLMMVSPREVEDAICRLAQMARACGMHLVIATQRPSVDVITGLIKANIPSRIAFAVSSQTDSRTILDAAGADKLLGRGDMLYYPMGESKPLRVQGAFISEEEVVSVTDFIRSNSTAEEEESIEEEIAGMAQSASEDEDPLMEEVIAFIVEKDQASTSMIQRRFKIGYNRAARMIDELEKRGIVAGAEGSKPRRVLMEKE